MAGARVMGSAAFGWVLFRFWAHRDILRRRTTLVANQSIAEVDGQPSIAEDDALDLNGLGAFLLTTRPSLGLASGREKMKLSVRVTALSLAAVVPANHDNEMRDHGLLTS